MTILQPAYAQTTFITAVQLTSTEVGLSLVFEAAAESPLQTFVNQGDSNTVVVDIVDAQLQIPEGDSFQQDNPTAGIESITVRSLATNRVQVTIVGQDAIPAVEITQSASNLIFAISPAVSDASIPDSEPPSPDTAESPDAFVVGESAGSDLRLVVTATRTEESLDDLGRSITVIDREQIEQQSIISPDLGDILGTLVPGFGPPNQLNTARGQTLRGREAAVLIDGVPLSTNFRVNRQELRSIDPSAIERIEIIRGPSAIYGGQSTGGVINIITRRPGVDEFIADGQIGLSAPLTNQDGNGGGFGNNFAFSIAGGGEQADFRVSASREQTGSFFDAEGNRIVSESSLSDTTTYNLLGRIGYNINEQQRLDLTVNYFDAQRDTEFIADPATVAINGRQTAQALRIPGLTRDRNPGDRNFLVNLSYSHTELLGSELQAQLYFQETTAIGDFNDGRPGNPPQFFPFLFRSRLEAERWGSRLQIETPLNADGTLNLLWGADYESQENQQITTRFDNASFDNRNTLTPLQEFDFTPPYQLINLGLFTQVDWEASESLFLRGGLRYENISLNVGDYRSVQGRNVQGGSINFDDLVFNASAVYQPIEEISLFASFAQSFSVPEFSRILRLPPVGFSIARDINITQPIKVTEYEIGVRGNWPSVQTSLSGFYNTSDFGSSLVPDANGLLSVQRAPQRIYGIEATVDWQPADQWGLGGTISWSEGENDVNQDGDFVALNSGEIAPLKLTAYLENETLPGWNNRLQVLFVGSRSRGFDAGVENFPIESYVTIDFISSVDIGSGTLQVGIENLFNTQYFPAITQFLGGFDDRLYNGGRGRSLRITYSVTW